MNDTPARSSPRGQRASLTGARWIVPHIDEQAVRLLSGKLSPAPLDGQAVGRTIAQVLVSRGLTDPAEASAFLRRDLGMLHDPAAMKDMDRAVGLVDRALATGARIRVYGDYDVDGVCATALLVRALSALGGTVDWHVPHRIDEGYGLSEEAVRLAHADGVGLLITVDCGASALDEVAVARQLGLEVIITDHHRPGEALPEAPVLDPWRADCQYPFKDLSGVGVAFKLVSALARARGLRQDAEMRFLDLVCLGTIGDVAPLLGENRVFVHHGLQQLPGSRKLGIAALLKAAGVTGEVQARHVAFALAPRINAAGRMEHAQAAVRLLLSNDAEEASALAQGLSDQNDRRRDQERQILAEAEARVVGEVDLDREWVIVLASEAWHPGVIGIVASRLVERYHRPALLIAVADGVGKGSGRSIAAFNLWAGLRECASLLSRYGGHHFAAGFAISEDRIPQLRERINAVAAACLSRDDLVRNITTDGEVELGELTVEAVGQLSHLAPLGMGNPPPMFVTREVEVSEVSAVGDGSHLAMRLQHRSVPTGVAAVWFGHGAALRSLSPGTVVDICHRPGLDEWHGDVRVRLRIEDVARH